MIDLKNNYNITNPNIIWRWIPLNIFLLFQFIRFYQMREISFHAS